MKVLTRTLLRAHVGPFLFAFFALSGVVLVNTLARQLAELAGRGLPARVVGEFVLLSLPANVALTAPMAVLVAVLYTFSQMTMENEITALKASGIDQRRLGVPLLVAGLLGAAGLAWFNDRVLPEANHRWRLLMNDIARTSPLLVVQEQTLTPIPSLDGRTRYVLRADRIDATGNRLWGVTIYDLSDPALARTIYADSGRMAFNAARTDLFLTLFDGQLRQVRWDDTAAFQQLQFRRQLLRVPNVADTLRRTREDQSWRGDRELTVPMLRARIDSLRSELRGVRASDPAAGLRRRLLARQIRELEVELHKKYAIAAAAVVFVLIGVPFATRFPRGGVGMVIAVSLTVFSLYYVALIGGETLGDEGYVPPLWAMWGIDVVLGVLGLVGWWRLGWERVTPRGGGGLPLWWRRLGRGG